MALLVTPGYLSRRAEFYHQLGSMTAAGLPLIQALEHLRQNPPSPSFRQSLTHCIEYLERGTTFTEAIRSQRAWLAPFDIALLEAGERSGRLDSCFKLIGDYYEDRAKLMRGVISDLAYPVFLGHFAIFIIPIQDLLLGSASRYWWHTLGILFPIYGVVFFLLIACQGTRGARWRSLLETVSRAVPILGAGRRQLALARLSAALEALISAGVSIIEAWEMAAAASGSEALRRVVAAWRPRVLGGTTPAEAVRDSKVFPDMFTSLYMTGEKSGQLDDALRRLRVYYQTSGQGKLHELATWTPRLIYVGICLAIGYYIFSTLRGYYGQLSDVLK